MHWDTFFPQHERPPTVGCDQTCAGGQPPLHWSSLRRAMVGTLGVLSSVSLPTAVSAQPPPADFWSMHPMWGIWGAWGFGMFLMMLVFWGLLIVGLVLAIRWLISQGRESRSTTRTDSALDILRQRYARGEIDKEEFEAKKRDLS